MVGVAAYAAAWACKPVPCISEGINPYTFTMFTMFTHGRTSNPLLAM